MQHTPVSARMVGPAMGATFLTAQGIPTVLTEVRHRYPKLLIIRFPQRFIGSKYLLCVMKP